MNCFFVKNENNKSESQTTFNNGSLYDDMNFNSSNSPTEKNMYCETCKTNYSDISHLTSISHQASKVAKAEKINHFPIGYDNLGYKLLKNAGWDGNSGLGANKQGRIYPIKGIMKNDKFGIGIKSKNIPKKPKPPKHITKKEINQKISVEESKAKRLQLLFSNRPDFETEYLDKLMFGDHD